ncbi:lytic transglycosylase domain-containing protein [Pseudomonas amygdali]|nr:lytic transglycosylase domain-containing protein [Pseudomonas amygdali]
MRCLWLVLALSAPMQASAFCFQEAGQRYGVDPVLLQAIGIQESKLQPGAVNLNRDSSGKVLSTDYGVMQISTRNANRLVRMRLITRAEDLLTNACFNVQAGAWYWLNIFVCAAIPGVAWVRITQALTLRNAKSNGACITRSKCVTSTTASKHWALHRPTSLSVNDCARFGVSGDYR